MIYLRCGNDYDGTGRIRLAFTDRDTGEPIDISGYDVWFAIKRKSHGVDDADAYVFKTTDDDVEVDPDQVTNTGIAWVALDRTETAAIPVGCWYYSAQGSDGTRIVEVGPSRVTVEADFIEATAV